MKNSYPNCIHWCYKGELYSNL